MSNRGNQWNEFSSEVHKHIENYTVPQYGDAPNDLASQYSKGDFDMQLRKYITRQANGGGCRGIKNDMLDYLKIAHYASMAYMKMKEHLDE